jgi:hypothetical protein
MPFVKLAKPQPLVILSKAKELTNYEDASRLAGSLAFARDDPAGKVSFRGCDFCIWKKQLIEVIRSV